MPSTQSDEIRGICEQSGDHGRLSADGATVYRDQATHNVNQQGGISFGGSHNSYNMNRT